MHVDVGSPRSMGTIKLLLLTGMGAMNGGLGASMANGSAASSMDALTQAYSGMQQYTASALPALYSQSLLQQSVAGSQKEGEKIPGTHHSIRFFRSFFLNAMNFYVYSKCFVCI